MPFAQACAVAFLTGVIATMAGLTLLPTLGLIVVTGAIPHAVHEFRR